MALKIESMRFKNHLLLFLACLFIHSFYAPRMASAKLLQVKADGSGDFQTVQSCVDQAIAGDTCLVSSGNFPERVSTKRNGTLTSPIIIKSQGNTIIQGFEIIHDYITVDGFEIFHNLNGNCAVDTNAIGGINIRGSYATVINNYIHDMKGVAGIYSLYIATGVIVRNNRIFHSQYGIRISGDSWLVENNEVDHPYPHCSNTDVDYIRFFGTGHVIRGNYLHGATYAETPIEVAHLDCFQSFDNNAVNVTKNILIENNMCLDAHDGIITEGHYNKKTSDITVRNNVFARMLLPSMNFTLNFSDTPNVIVEGNTIALGNGGAVASLYQNVSPPMNAVIKNNIFTGFGPYRSIAYSDGDMSLIEDYNLITSKTGSSNTAAPGAHDLLGASPSFVNLNDIEGPDKIPFTADDGLRLLSTSTVCGKGENSGDMGAYACGNVTIVPPDQSSHVIHAASCSSSDVQTAINSSSEGDIISVPQGICTYTTPVTISKGITLQGAGVDLSTIVTRVPIYGASIIISPGVSNVRITGFTFDDQTDSPTQQFMAIRVGTFNQDTGGVANFRIDNNRFKDFRRPGEEGNQHYVIRTYGFNYGVIDHNSFIDCRGEIIYVAGDGTEAYGRDTNLGGYENGTVFVEDNKFILTGVEPYYGSNAVDMNEGARVVFRHNSFQDVPTSRWVQPVDTHGFCVCDGQCTNPTDLRGTLSYEVYGNTFTTTASSDLWKWGINLRGGHGAIFDNNFSGTWGTVVHFTNERSYSYPCTQVTTISDPRPKYESECHKDTDSGGSLLNEGIVNGTMVFGQCRDQVNEVYVFNNKVNGTTVLPSQLQVSNNGYEQQDIVPGRNFFLDQQPASYTPYPYPHPLTLNQTYLLSVVNGSGGGAYSPGTVVSLRAITAPKGKIFDKWVADPVSGVNAATPNNSLSSFVMPASNVTLTATFIDTAVPVYKLTVINGTGSGSYPEGNSISIAASSTLNGQIFDRWIGAAVANDMNSSTTLLMPHADTTVTATYKDISSPGKFDGTSQSEQSDVGFLSFNSVVSTEHSLVGEFNLASNSNVKISIVDRRDNLIRELSQSDMKAGLNSFSWDGKNSRGEFVSSGIFLIKLDINGKVFLKKIVVVK